MTKELTVAASKEILAQLAQSYPTEAGSNTIYLPRLGMYSQDKTTEEGTGKAKKITVVNAAGEFYFEHQTDEEVDGKKQWVTEEQGDTIEAIIVYKRHQLRMYDNATEEFTNSPVYDDANEVLPLFCNRTEVARGTPAELKAKYMYTDENGKQKSRLEDSRILYVLYQGELYQMNLRGSSMYSFLSYERALKVAPNTVLTQLTSEQCEKGATVWNKMLFTKVRDITEKEAEKVVEIVQETQDAIGASKAQYAGVAAQAPQAYVPAGIDPTKEF